MKPLRTVHVARITGIHPNTVRLYEELGLITKPQRQANGYRLFTPLHIQQIRLVRTALRIEVLQNGLRKQAIAIIKLAATQDFDAAITQTQRYLQQIEQQHRNAEEAIAITAKLLEGGGIKDDGSTYTRKQAADRLQITIDALRNWEMNGLLQVKRRHNGYRVYTGEDILRLKIIRSLRCANYSHAAILRMLSAINADPTADIRTVIDTPQPDEDIISVCDKLLTSLQNAHENARSMLAQLQEMKRQFTPAL